MTDRTRARTLARQSLDAGDAVGWFERLYSEAARGEALVPWADLAPNPRVVAWLDRARPTRGRVLDVGCGLGDTAEELARRGLTVVAVDVSPTAVAQARARFPSSRVDYRVLDLLRLPVELAGAFDLVVECYTLQVLPPDARADDGAALRRAVTPGGTLLVVARARESNEPEGQMPWPLTRSEIEAIADDTLRLATCDDFVDREQPPVRRFRATFRRDARS
ncbi:MAG: class I SAM-dependent methyltransferase [Deltaproteobacteria bacterium]|nr:class I SAM-dependent methyltransferase [Deltaproteobacteria bacterium]